MQDKIDASRWMEQIFSEEGKGGTKLSEIFIPGTHDAATDKITSSSPFAKVEMLEKKNLAVSAFLKELTEAGVLEQGLEESIRTLPRKVIDPLKDKSDRILDKLEGLTNYLSSSINSLEGEVTGKVPDVLGSRDKVRDALKSCTGGIINSVAEIDKLPEELRSALEDPLKEIEERSVADQIGQYIAGWAKAQDCSISEQLEDGIRFFRFAAMCKGSIWRRIWPTGCNVVDESLPILRAA